MRQVLTLLLLLPGILTIAQPKRYLELKTYDQLEWGAKNLEWSSFITSNTDNSLLAISVGLRGGYVLNLATGKVVYSNKESEGQLIFVGNMLVQGASRQGEQAFIIDPVTFEKREYKGGPGMIQTEIGAGNYFLVSNIFQKTTKIFAIENGDMKEVMSFGEELLNARMTKNGYVIGMSKGEGSFYNYYDVYHAPTGKLVSRFNNKPARLKSASDIIILYNPYYLDKINKLIGTHDSDDIYSKTRRIIKTDVTLLDTNGKSAIIGLDDGEFMNVNDAQTEVTTVNREGRIIQRSIPSGRLLANERATYSIPLNGSHEERQTKGYPLKSAYNSFKLRGGEFYLVPYRTGITSLYSTKARKVIANLFFDNEDWAVIATDGRFDGTAGAFDKLEWREYEGDVLKGRYSLETSFDKYYTPRLLYRLLNNDDAGNTLSAISFEELSQVPRIASLVFDGKQMAISRETVELQSSQKNISISFQTGSNTAVSEMLLYHNNKLIATKPKSNDNIYVFSVALNKVNGDNNYLYAVAKGKNGLDSEKAKLLIRYSASESVVPRLFVLVTGINSYQNTKYNLNYALPDAKSISSQLASPSELFQSVNVKTLYDVQVTKENLISTFNQLSKEVGENDVFIFYYAGHGTVSDGSQNPEFFLVPHDVTQLYGNNDLLAKRGFSAKELKDVSLSIRAQKQVFIIDACHSAGALTSASTRGAAEERAIGQLARSTGTYWITASGADQYATEFQQLGHGVFTYSLLEALQGKNSSISEDGNVTIREICTYLEQRVPELSQKYKGDPQYPASFSFGNDFPIILIKK